MESPGRSTGSKAPDAAPDRKDRREIRRPTRRQWLLVVSVTLGVLLLGTTAAAGMLLLRFNAGVDRVEVEGLGEETATPEREEPEGYEGADPGQGGPGRPERVRDHPGYRDQASLPDPVDEVVTVLLVASDDRSVLTEEEQAEYSTGDVGGERTEAIMLARLDPDGPRIDMLRIPRDSVVERCDGSSGRINAAYLIGENIGVGGATCLVETVRAWTGVRPDHFAKVDFRGFVDIVDAVGGVELWLDEPIQDDNAGLDVGDGCQRLEGRDALAFARARSIDNDFGRIARQQRLIRELREEVVSGRTAISPRRLLNLVDAAAGALEVDESMTLNRMRQLAVAAVDVPAEQIHTATVPGTLSTEGPSVLYIDDDDLDRLISDLQAGELGDEPDPQLPGTSPRPQDPDEDDPGDGDGDRQRSPYVGVDRGPGCD